MNTEVNFLLERVGTIPLKLLFEVLTSNGTSYFREQRGDAKVL